MLAHSSLSRILSRRFVPSKSTLPFDGTNSGHVSLSYLLHLFRLAGSPKSLRIPLIEWENGMHGLQPLPSAPPLSLSLSPSLTSLYLPPWQLGIKFPIFHLTTESSGLSLLQTRRGHGSTRNVRRKSRFFPFLPFHVRSLPCRVSRTARSLSYEQRYASILCPIGEHLLNFDRMNLFLFLIWGFRVASRSLATCWNSYIWSSSWVCFR